MSPMLKISSNTKVVGVKGTHNPDAQNVWIIYNTWKVKNGRIQGEM